MEELKKKKASLTSKLMETNTAKKEKKRPEDRSAYRGEGMVAPPSEVRTLMDPKALIY